MLIFCLYAFYIYRTALDQDRRIRTFLLFNIASFSITRGFWSARAWKSSQNKHGAGSPGVPGERWLKFFLEPVMSLVFRFQSCVPETQRTLTKKIVEFHIISIVWTDRDKVVNRQSCPLSEFDAVSLFLIHHLVGSFKELFPFCPLIF